MSFSSRTGGQILISTFGKNITNGYVDIYQNLITTGDEITLSIDSLSSGSYDYTYIRDKGGNIISQAQGDEVEPFGEVSFSVYEDFSYAKSRSVYGSSKNKLLCLINGESFINNDDTIVPIGTNGTDKTKTSVAKAREINLPYKNLLYFEGGFIKNKGTATENGESTFRKNPFSDSFNLTHKTISFEIKTTNGEGSECKFIPILAKTSAEWVEGDLNKFDFTANRGCDVWFRNDFWTEVHKGEIVLDKAMLYGIPTDTCRSEISENAKIYNLNCEMLVKELYVEFIVSLDTLSKSEGNIGDLACVINQDGVIAIQVKTKYGWETDYSITSALRQGIRLKSNKLKIDNNIKEVNVFVGILQNGKAIRFSTSESVKKYYAIVYDLDKDTGNFEEYLTV